MSEEETHKIFELNNGTVLELEDVFLLMLLVRLKLTWQALSELLFTLSSVVFQRNSDSPQYYVGAFNLLQISDMLYCFYFFIPLPFFLFRL